MVKDVWKMMSTCSNKATRKHTHTLSLIGARKLLSENKNMIEYDEVHKSNRFGGLQIKWVNFCDDGLWWINRSPSPIFPLCFAALRCNCKWNFAVDLVHFNLKFSSVYRFNWNTELGKIGSYDDIVRIQSHFLSNSLLIQSLSFFTLSFPNYS